jgi:TRAP-type C4-dicarboxylate transport system substrate-binding protein
MLVSQREHYEDLVNGICDISYSQPGSAPFGFDIHRAMQPWGFGVPEPQDRIDLMNEMFAKFPEIPGEFDRAKILSTGHGQDYQLITSKPVRTPADIKGMSVKAMGAYGDWINSMGGEGVPLPMSESYISLQKGIIDGVLAPYETLQTFRFGEVAPYCTIAQVTSSVYTERAMNWDSYNSLPPDIQKVFDDSYDFYAQEIARQFDIKNEEGLAVGKEMGMEFIKPTPEAMKEFFMYLEAICLKSAKELDAKGYRGTEMFNEMRRLAEQYTK